MKRCNGCGRRVSVPHAFGCGLASKTALGNVESEHADPDSEAYVERPRRRSILSIASLSILGDL